MAKFRELLADPDHTNQNVNFSDLVDTDKIAKSNTNTFSEGDSNGYNYTRNSLDRGDITPYDLPNLEDERATNQSTVGALGDAFAKFAGKTVLSTIGNIAGTIYGVGDAIANGQWSKIWDNSFMDAVDAGDKKLDNIFKVYRNADYADQNILQKLALHPTQFADEATDTASFMAGSVLAEIATSGLGSETIVPRMLKYFKYLGEGAEAAEATKNLTSFGAKAITLGGDFGTSIKHLAMGASYEGIVEARQATMELRNKMYEDYSKDHPNEAIPQHIKDDIDDRLSNAGIATYFGNLALVGGTNLLLFPKLFGLGHDTAKLATGAIEKNAETGLFESAVSKRLAEGKSKYSLAQNIATALEKPVEESTKFGVQGTISKTAREFFDRKNDPEAKKDVSDFISEFGTNLMKTYTSKEGWDNIGMGMIIGALGAPGRGILSPLGESNPLGKYGYKDVLDENGVKIGSEKLPMWTGGAKGSFDERVEKEHKIGKVLNDLNQHTNLFKAMQANYDALVENSSLQRDQDAAIEAGDIFNFQNAKDDQIHSYVSARIKNNLFDDLMDEVDKIKRLSPDEFYKNFKGESAADNTTNIDKIKFQQETTKQFLDKANNTKEAIKIADNVYRGDNDDLREHLIHSIAAAKNLDVREKAMNQSLADLSGGVISNYELASTSTNTLAERIKNNERLLADDSVSKEDKEKIANQNKLFKQGANLDLTPEEHDLMSRLAQTNPTQYVLNNKKIEQLLQDSRKLRAKRQDYLDIYNHLFTQEGQKQFEKTQENIKIQIQKQQAEDLKKEQDKQAEAEKVKNNKATVAKAKKVKEATVVTPPVTSNKASGETIKEETEPTIVKKDDEVEEPKNTVKEKVTETSVSTELESVKQDEPEELTPEENAVVAINENDEVKVNRELITTDTGLATNPTEEHFQQVGNYGVWNLDLQRTIGNVISYLNINKSVLERLALDDKTVEKKTVDNFDDEGNLEINKHVDPKLASQNYYKPNDVITFSIPTFSEMEERGLQEYDEKKYEANKDNVKEFDIAIKGEDGKIVGYLPTQSGIEKLVAEEFRDDALASNLTLRQFIFENKDSEFKGTITSKSPGMLMLDKRSNQKSLFESLGDGKQLADKVKLGITKPLNKDAQVSSKDLYTDMSSNPFSDGNVINGEELEAGIVYAIMPTSSKDDYVVYPMKVNTIGIDAASTIVEAIKLHHLINSNEVSKDSDEAKSIYNIAEYNISNFKDLVEFINRIMYTSTDGSDRTLFRISKNGNLILSKLDKSKMFSLSDIATSEITRQAVIDELKNRFASVKLDGLNSGSKYRSYHLEDGIINEKVNDNYQSYLNDNKVLTSNIRSIPIEENERAFTAQSVIGVSNTVEKNTKLLTEGDKIEETPTETPKESNRVVESKDQTPPITKDTLKVNKKKIKPLEDINPEFIEKNNIKSGEDLIKKCL